MIADAPDWVQAIVLGIVQGLTEFIPVSSSAHLVLVPALAGWERHGLAFDVALHLGTLLALIVYYRRDLTGMVRALLSRTATPDREAYRRLIVLLAAASLPVAIAGLLLKDAVESLFSAPIATAWLLLVTAAVLIGGEAIRRRRLDRAGVGTPAVALGSDHAPPADSLRREPVGWRQAMIVGVMQSFALLPGLSRSGLTISAGVAAGLSRAAATRFAFLLGLPAIAGAAIVQLPQVDDLDRMTATELAAGVVAAGVSGYLAIAFLVRLVARVGIDRFAWYVVPLALVSLFVLG